MKDLTKFICDLISFGTQIDKSSAPTEQRMSCLAGLVLSEDIAHIGTLDYDQIRNHIENLQSSLNRGSDFDIDDVRRRLAQGQVVSAGEILNHMPLGVKDVVEFHGKYTVKLSNGREVTFNSFDVTHY